MEILNKLTELSESLGLGKEKVEQVKSDVEAFGAVKFEEGKQAGIVEGKLLGFEEGKKVGYEEGFSAGVASVPVSPVVEVPVASDKIYSQVEMDAALIVKSNEVKASIKAKYEEAQLKESEIEASLFAAEPVPEVPVAPVVEPVVEAPAEPVV